MAEPIHRVGAVRSGAEPVAGAARLERVEREDRAAEDEERRRRRGAPARARQVVQRDADGVPHVDVRV